jgi:hypothetical protein
MAVVHAVRPRWLLVAGALVTVALLLPAGADAAKKKSHKLEGRMSGDPNSSISITVVTRGGDPKRVKRLRYRNLDTFCDLDDEVGFETPAGDRSGSAGRNIGPGIEFDNSFRWVSFPQVPPRQVNVVGKVKRRGKKVTGTIEVLDNEVPVCQAEGRFTASK